MSLGNEVRYNNVFLNLSRGKFNLAVNVKTEGEVAAAIKDGAVKITHDSGESYFKQYDTLIGKIFSINPKEVVNHQKRWVVKVFDEKTNTMYNVQMLYSSRYATGILSKLPNIDLTKEVKFKAGIFIEGKKQTPYVTIWQNGQKVSNYYTKEDPKGLPKMEKILNPNGKPLMVSGREVWSMEAMMDFLEKMVETQINPKLAKIFGNTTNEDETESSCINDSVTEKNIGNESYHDNYPDSDDDGKDIPF